MLKAAGDQGILGAISRGAGGEAGVRALEVEREVHGEGREAQEGGLEEGRGVGGRGVAGFVGAVCLEWGWVGAQVTTTNKWDDTTNSNSMSQNVLD